MHRATMYLVAGLVTTAFLPLALRAQPQPERAGFTVPSAPWILVVPLKGLAVTKQQFKPDGRAGYFMLSGGDSGFNVSVFIEPERKCHTSRECRDMVWKGLKPTLKGPVDIVTTEVGDVSIVEFLLPTFQGLAVRQFNLYAEYVKDGYWVDLHATKVAYKPEDRSLFLDLLAAITFSEKPSTTATPSGA